MTRIYKRIALVDYVDFLPSYEPHCRYTQQIPANLSSVKTINRYWSWFGNLGYTYGSRYIFSASVRERTNPIFSGVNILPTRKRSAPWLGGFGMENQRRSGFTTSRHLPLTFNSA